MGIVKPKVVFFPSGDPDYIYIYSKNPIGTDAVVTDSITKVIENRVFAFIKKEGYAKIVNSVISNVGKNAGDPMNPDRGATPHKSKVTIAFEKLQLRDGIKTGEVLNKITPEFNIEEFKKIEKEENSKANILDYNVVAYNCDINLLFQND
jgi:multidrug efflux pump subunit AcrB